MADKTKIEWADATVNFINGCEILSPGCTNCYAMALAGGRLKNVASRRGLTHEVKGKPVWNGMVRHHLPELWKPLAWRRPRRIFWNAHGDMFLGSVPRQWIDMQFAVMAVTARHTHMILSKRTKDMRAYLNNPDTPRRITAVLFDFHRKGVITAAQLFAALVDRHAEAAPESVAWPLPSVWVGTSVEDQDRDIRIGDLRACPAAIRFISFEPLLGPVIADLAGIDWAIVGGESGPRPMHPDWARSLRDQCAAAGVLFFFKQWGSFLPGDMWGEDENGAPAYEIDDVAQPVDYDALGRGKLIHAHGADFIHFHRKSVTGRMLDGVEHNGFPETHHDH